VALSCLIFIVGIIALFYHLFCLKKKIILDMFLNILSKYTKKYFLIN